MQWPKPNQKPSWSRLRIFLISSLLFLLVVSSLAWRQPPDARSAQQPTPTVLAPTLIETESAETNPAAAGQAATAVPRVSLVPTLLPPEYLTNSQQTTGIILIASIMVLMVVAGVLRTLVSEKRSP